MHPLIHQVLVLFLKTKKQSLHKPVPLLPSPSVSPSASSSFPWWQEGWWKCACRPLHLSHLSSSTAHRQTVPQTFLWSTSPGNETNTHSRNVYTSDKPTTTKENIFRLLFSLWMCCVPCYTYIYAQQLLSTVFVDLKTKQTYIWRTLDNAENKQWNRDPGLYMLTYFWGSFWRAGEFGIQRIEHFALHLLFLDFHQVCLKQQFLKHKQEQYYRSCSLKGNQTDFSNG